MTATDAGKPRFRRLRIVHALPVVPLFLVGLLVAGNVADNSFLWHIRAGSLQASTGTVLSSDPFSFSRFGESWRTQSWLAELGYAQMESWFTGLGWANWMVFTASVVIVGLMGIAVYRRTPSPVTTGVILVLAVWLVAPFMQPRPVIFSFILLAALVVVLQNREQALWLVVPIIWIWAGVHGSWIIGGLLIALEWIRTADRRLFTAGALALVASLATPHGFGTWQIVIDFLGAQDALALMQEWKVPDFGSPAQMPYVLVLAGIIGASIRGKVAPRDLVVILPFLFLGLTARRTVVPATIVLLPWAAAAFPPIQVPRARARLVPFVAVTVLAVLALVPMLVAQNGRLLAERFPSDGAREAMAGLVTFQDTAAGGYLIYREFPDRLVWIDDRAELYGVEMLTEYTDAVSGRYEDTFAKYGFEAALTQASWPLTERLINDGWTTAYEDEYFLVLLPPE
jgi:hypothetical protein